MQSFVVRVLFTMLLAGYEYAYAQMAVLRPQKPVICYQLFENRPDHVGISETVLAMRQRSTARTKTATIEVEYINFPADNLARKAFEYAVNIWEMELTSAVPIRVRAEWRALGSGVIGQAIWGSAYANFGGEQYIDTFYPVALAEKISGREINGVNEPDIVASFSSGASWYFGTDGKTPAGKMDMVTIVLHEIAHGLGFTDTYDVEDGVGTVGLASDGKAVPFVFDVFVENKGNQNLLHDFISPSQALATQLQSSDIFFDSPLAVSALSGIRPELYAPASFDNGSSVSHLDESIFSNQQDANRLMTPQIAFAESIHDPGAILMAMLGDMGWIHTYIDHEPLAHTERKDGNNYLVQARIRSDNGYDPTSVKLHYSTDGVNFDVVEMSSAGANLYEYRLPGTTVDMTYVYFISVTDVDERTFTSPGKTQRSGETPEQATHEFSIGTDAEAPEIVHEPVRHISENSQTLSITAEVTDNMAVKEVLVEYSVNGGEFKTLVAASNNDDFTTHIDLPVVSVGDDIQYRLIARDAAKVENMAMLPAKGFFVVNVTGVLPVRDSYANDFNSATSDFFGDGFTITTPAAFDDGAIHSDHPYDNGSGPNNQSSYTWQLQIPVRIGTANPVIKFDEIVLVEPGEDGSEFGEENFFDYVIVEGSTDKGVQWRPFSSGYDSRDNSMWLTRYNQHIVNDNSQAEGDPELYRTRTVDMLENGIFSEGDEVLIRFRLFADQFAYGWGWAIDNLSIQAPVTGVGERKPPSFSVYPVPATRSITAAIDGAAGPIDICIIDVHGRMSLRFAADHPGGPMELPISLEGLGDGVYLMRLETRSATLFKKFLKRTP